MFARCTIMTLATKKALELGLATLTLLLTVIIDELIDISTSGIVVIKDILMRDGVTATLWAHAP